jgi:hypothetical protein
MQAPESVHAPPFPDALQLAFNLDVPAPAEQLDESPPELTLPVQV